MIHCPLPQGSEALYCGTCTAHYPPKPAGSATHATYCLNARGQRAVQLLQHTTSLPGGSGQWDSCNALPHCLGAEGSATALTHPLTVWGHWAVQLLQYTASLPGISGNWNSCHAGASLRGGRAHYNSCNTLPYCMGAVGSGTLAMHCRTAWGQTAVQLLRCTASLPGGSGRWNSCNTLPHGWGAVGSGTPARHCLSALGRWVVQLLRCTAGSCNAP